MSTTNRFSVLLESLMTQANLKNITLAQELQYDVSYISKWVNGRMLPSEKGLEKILHGISGCIVEALDSRHRKLMFEKYNVADDSHLSNAIYDNLLIEYNYSKTLKADTPADSAPQISFYPELSMLQFINKIHHPVLRNVQSLDSIAMLDIFNMDRSSQLGISELQNAYSTGNRLYSGIHFSMLTDLSNAINSPVRNTEFFLNMINNFSNIDFHFFESKQSLGKAIFTVKGSFTISAMMTGSSHCMAATTTEDPETSIIMYNKLKSFCNQNSSLMNQSGMLEFIRDNYYIKAILSDHHKALLGCMTEHFFPESLFDTLIQAIPEGHLKDDDLQHIRKIHQISERILSEQATKFILIDSALRNLLVTGIVSCYHYKVYLTTGQRIKYLNHLISMTEHNPELKIRLLSRDSFPNFQLIGSPAVFLSDSMSYIDQTDISNQNALQIVNKASLDRMLHSAFDEIWKSIGPDAEAEAQTLLRQILHSLELLQSTELA